MAESKADCDLLHPLLPLKWRACTEAPVPIVKVQAVWLNGNVYFGDFERRCNILCYNAETNSWKSINSHIHWSALTTYQGKLVLVGGENNYGLETNKLWSLQENGRWAVELPPMPTPRWGASAVNTGNHLIVAGGYSIAYRSVLKVVEVFDGKKWSRVESLPVGISSTDSILHNGVWYVKAGMWGIFCASVDSIVASVWPGEGEEDSVWKTLPKTPLNRSSISIYGNQLLAIGGSDNTHQRQSTIFGYTSDTRSWRCVGELPAPMDSTCSIVLPSLELLVIGITGSDNRCSSSVFKATIRVPTLQQSCVMAITRSSIDCLQLPPHLQKMVETHSQE